MANNSAEGIRWDLSDLFTAHDDPQIETTLNDCRARAEKFAERFRRRWKIRKHSPPTPCSTRSRNWKSSMRPSAESAATPACFTPPTPRSRSIKTWNNKSSSASTEISNLLLFFELEWLKVEDEIANRLIMAIRRSNPTAIISRACAATARTRSRNWKRKSSTKKTTPAATPSAGCFRRSHHR